MPPPARNRRRRKSRPAAILAAAHHVGLWAAQFGLCHGPGSRPPSLPKVHTVPTYIQLGVLCCAVPRPYCRRRRRRRRPPQVPTQAVVEQPVQTTSPFTPLATWPLRRVAPCHCPVWPVVRACRLSEEKCARAARIPMPALEGSACPVTALLLNQARFESSFLHAGQPAPNRAAIRSVVAVASCFRAGPRPRVDGVPSAISPQASPGNPPSKRATRTATAAHLVSALATRGVRS
jgi:hypothetical protein